MTNTIQIATETRLAIVPVTLFVRASRRTERTLAGQAVLSMLHAWGTASACAAHNNLMHAASETITYAATVRS